MKQLKKMLCVVLTAVFMFSAVSTGVVAFAQDNDVSEAYESLAYQFFSYSDVGNKKVIDTDEETGYIKATILRDMNQYTVHNEQGDYVYADENGLPIRLFTYNHVVTAKDDINRTIRNAANTFYSLLNLGGVMSKEYGVGNYTIDRVASAVKAGLKNVKDEDGNPLFFDGKSYFTDDYGELVSVTDFTTCFLDENGDVVHYNVYDAENDKLSYDASKPAVSSLSELIEDGDETSNLSVYLQSISYADNESTLYDYMNVDTVIDYFCGNCTSINESNWFHTFEFKCETDVDTILSNDELIRAAIPIFSLDVVWDTNRFYDESGTKARYVNNGFTMTTNDGGTDEVRYTLCDLKNEISRYIQDYYSIVDAEQSSVALEKIKNETILDTEYEKIRAYYDKFSELSSEAKVNCFGDDAYTYMHLVTQLTPISTSTTYLPSRTSVDYTDESGEPVVYQVTVDKVTNFVNIIDGLLSNEKIGNILKAFIKPGDTENFVGGADYTDGIDLIQALIKNLLYQDSIINLVLTGIYPMLTNLIDENITDQFIEDTLTDLVGSSLSGTVESLCGSILNDEGGWQAAVYRVLAKNGIGITPGGVAWNMKKMGYDKEFSSVWSYLTFCGNLTVYDTDESGLPYKEDGSEDYVILDSSLQSLPYTDGDTTYYGVIGKENDKYMLNRWGAVNSDLLFWGVDGDETKFESALSAALCPLAGLLVAVLGNIEDYKLYVGKFLSAKLYLKISNSAGYEQILLPLFEALGITDGLVTPEEFQNDSQALYDAMSNETIDSDKSKQIISDIISPLLKFISEKVIVNPIHWITELLPNVSYYLTSGALLASIQDFSIELGFHWAALIPISKHDVYVLNVGDLLGDNLDFLTSLDNILKLVSLGGSTGNPIIGYSVTYQTSEGLTQDDRMVYSSRDEAEYVANSNGAVAGKTVITELTEYYANDDLSVKSLDKDSSTPNKVTGLNADGSINYDVCLFNTVGYKNADGTSVISKDELTAENSGTYSVAVTEFYRYYQYLNEDGETVTSTDKPELDPTQYTFVETLTKPDDSINYEYVVDPVMQSEDVALPALMDYKLQACGTLTTTTSLRTSTVATNDGGWASGQRKYIDMHLTDSSTGKSEDSAGFVILYILRYLFCSINVRSYDVDSQSFKTMSVLDSLGLGDSLDDDLFYGLSLGDIVDNITLNPDGAIASLWELFQKNEFGSLFVIDESTQQAVKGSRYTYYMEPVDYKYSSIAPYLNTDRTFGTGARYSEYWTAEDSQYVIGNIDNIVEAVFSMLKIENTQSLSDFLQGYVDEYVCNDGVITRMTRWCYQFISELDLEAVFENVLGVNYSKELIIDILTEKFGADYEPVLYLQADINRKRAQYLADGTCSTAEEAYQKALHTYDYYTFYTTGVDEETNEEIDIPCSWGFDDPEVLSVVGGNKQELFLTLVSSVFSPLAFIIKYLFLDEDISVFELITIPTYAGYYYAWGPLMEGLSAMDCISYQDYYYKVYSNDFEEYEQNYNCLYYFAKPLISLVNDIIEDPVTTVLSLVPNLLYFINNGAFADVINNLIHFVYVLIDMLEPIYDIKGLANKFLSNLEVAGFELNLELPLDIDVNSIINTVLDSVLGDLFPIELENKNIVIGTHTELVDQIKTDENGNTVYQVNELGEEIVNEAGEKIPVTEKVEVEVEDYQKAYLNVKLPYFDLSSLCVGSMQAYVSPSTGLNAVRLATTSDVIFDEDGSTQTTSGTDFVTYLLRFVFDTLLLEDNTENIEAFLDQYADLNSDDAETLNEVLTALRDLALEYDVVDRAMGAVLKLLKFLIPIVDTLGDRFEKVDFSITDLIDSASDIDVLLIRIKALMSAGGNENTEVTETLTGFAKIASKLANFFKNIINFFRSLFAGVSA